MWREQRKARRHEADIKMGSARCMCGRRGKITTSQRTGGLLPRPDALLFLFLISLMSLVTLLLLSVCLSICVACMPQSEAGEALVAALCASSRCDVAEQLCEEMRVRIAASATSSSSASAGGLSALSASPDLVLPALLPSLNNGDAGGGGVGWALRSLARLQRDGGSSEAAVASYQVSLSSCWGSEALGRRQSSSRTPLPD